MPRSATLAVLTAALLGACAGADAPTQPVAARRLAPAAGPALDGATVERFEHAGQAFWLHWSPFSNYTFTLGLVTPIENFRVCGGALGAPVVLDGRWRVQEVTGPTGIVHYTERLVEPATVVLYAAAFPDVVGGFCGLADVPVIARGTVTADLQNDNDRLGGGGPGANSWGRRLVGTVELTGGGLARLVIVQRLVARPSDPADAPLVPVVDRIMLQPIGGR